MKRFRVIFKCCLGRVALKKSIYMAAAGTDS
jgi:hypothetical protein